MPPSAPELYRLSGFTRRTSEGDLDTYNRDWRQSSIYQDFLRANGLVDTGRGVKLTRGQQSALEDRAREAGIRIPSGFHIDQGGNFNQTNRLGKYATIGAAAAGTLFGIPGVVPGLLTSGGGAAAGGVAGTAGGGAGVLPSTALGGAYMGAAPGAGLIGTGTALAGGGAAVVPTLKRLAGGDGMTTGDWLKTGASWGLDLFNNWQEAGAVNRQFESEVDYRNRALGLQEQQWRDELAQRQREWEDRYGLEREQFGLTRDRFGLELADWEQTRTNRAPYVSAGTGAVRALARGLGTGMPDVPQATAPTWSHAPSSGFWPGGGDEGIANQETGAPLSPVPQSDSLNVSLPRGFFESYRNAPNRNTGVTGYGFPYGVPAPPVESTASGGTTTPALRSTAFTLGRMAGPRPAAATRTGATVMMVAPTGERRALSPEDAAKAERLGARRVS